MVEPPPGGPVDLTPPHLVDFEPDSAAVGLVAVDRLTLTFSEKMDRTSANAWLHFFPDQRIRKTKWKGAVTAEIELETALPPDTVIVVEVAGGMRDAHKVENRVSRRFPIATADSIPTGSLRGVLIMGDSAVTNGVVELYDVPPDTLEYFQQPLLRRTTTDAQGTYRFDWLPAPGGPWLLRAFVDTDANLRPGERDPQRLLPDTLSLTTANPQVAAGVTTLYGVNEPGRLVTGAFPAFPHPGAVRAWTMAIGEADTGWSPAPPPANTVYSTLDPAAGGTVAGVAPGVNRLVMFSDVDGDSTFSAIPDSLLDVGTAAADSAWTGWLLEPWALLENLVVEPGLASRFTLPDTLRTTLTPWAVPAPPDTQAAGLPDTTGGGDAEPAESEEDDEP